MPFHLDPLHTQHNKKLPFADDKCRELLNTFSWNICSNLCSLSNSHSTHSCITWDLSWAGIAPTARGKWVELQDKAAVESQQLSSNHGLERHQFWSVLCQKEERPSILSFAGFFSYSHCITVMKIIGRRKIWKSEADFYIIFLIHKGYIRSKWLIQQP